MQGLGLGFSGCSRVGYDRMLAVLFSLSYRHKQEIALVVI